MLANVASHECFSFLPRHEHEPLLNKMQTSFCAVKVKKENRYLHKNCSLQIIFSIWDMNSAVESFKCIFFFPAALLFAPFALSRLPSSSIISERKQTADISPTLAARTIEQSRRISSTAHSPLWPRPQSRPDLKPVVWAVCKNVAGP